MSGRVFATASQRSFPHDESPRACYANRMSKLPDRDQILAWISENPAHASRRDVARAFGIKGALRTDLARLLRELEEEGHLRKRSGNRRDPDRLPPVAVLEVMAPNDSGELFARTLEWRGSGPEPRVLVVDRQDGPALGEGDRILARLAKAGSADHDYEARPIRRIGSGPRRILGVFREEAGGGRIESVDKRADREWRVAKDASLEARDGELVEAESVANGSRVLSRSARVLARVGDASGPRAASLVAISSHGIPLDFPEDALSEARDAEPADPAGREDLRHLPFIAIDPVDARDRDDAVYARADDDPANPGGHVIWVAISDVAHHVRPGSALDREARRRGNSTYFPDRVVPMLPDRLSGDLCSLHAGVPRACIAVEMTLDAEGGKLKHRFVRGIMQTEAALSYEQAQAARDGGPSDGAASPAAGTIGPLFEAYAALRSSRERRQPLEIDLPERKVSLDGDGRVESVGFQERLDAHRLIEEFMILANVAAAEQLHSRRIPLLFRVHEEPAHERLEALREIARACGFSLSKGQVVRPAHLNRLLEQAEGTEFDELINMAALRSMAQAYYHPGNFGHFGLALRNYAHFTSPIRRYSDLIVHRALISAHGWGDDGLGQEEIEMLDETAKHVSETERRSMAAERDATDRLLAAYMAERLGAEVTGRISGVQRFGAFVRLDGTGADGLAPTRFLGREHFRYDARAQTLTGIETGMVVGLGQRVTARLAEANPLTGGMILEPIEIEGQPAVSKRASRGGFRRKAARNGKRSGKSVKKTRRRR